MCREFGMALGGSQNINGDVAVALCTTRTTRALEIIDKQFAIECSCTLRSEL